MIGPRALLRLARADLLERVRQHGFLVTLGFAILAAWLFLPPNPSRYATFQFAAHRGIYNSAWVGGVIAMLGSTFLGLIGFYLVKNAVERDRRTGVGEILAATPLSRLAYLAAKLISNVAVLAILVGVLAVAAGGMQLVRGEDPQLRPLALLTPFVVLTLPVMALVAALAVVFEATPGLRGGFGNVVYFFLWSAGLTLTANAGAGGLPDPLGGEMLIAQMHAACAAAFPDMPSDRQFSMGFNIRNEGLWDLETFVWGGATWTGGMLASRALWVGVAIALTAAATLVFDRFDTRAAAGAPAGARRPRRASRSAPGERNARPPAADAAGAGPRPAAEALRLLGGDLPRGDATPAAKGGRLRLGGLARAEARIMLQGVSRWWFLVALGLGVACLFAPLPAVRGFVAPFALVWPLLCWSPMGTRERLHRTDALLFSTPRPVARLLAAQWLAGAALALAAAGGALARLAIAGDWSGVVALLIAAAFIPSLALASGIWTGSAKLFEVLYLALWYAGPMNRIVPLDFAGATQPGAGVGPPATFLALALLLAALALIGRSRQLRR